MEMTVKMGLHRNRKGSSSWVHRRDPSDRRRVQIQYDSIPSATRNRYELPTHDALLAQIRDEERREMLATLWAQQGNLFRTWDVNYYRYTIGMDEGKAEAYAQAASWMRLLQKANGRGAVRHIIPQISTKDELRSLIIEALEDAPMEGIQWGAIKTLRKWERRWKKGAAESEEAALDSLLHGNHGNSHAKKIDERVGKVLRSLYVNAGTDVKRLPAQVYREYVSMSQSGTDYVDSATGEVYERLPELCERSVTNYLQRPEVIASAMWERDGYKAMSDRVLPYVKGVRPRFSLSLLSADGEHIPFRLIEKGEKTWKRAVCYFVFDAKSGAVVGYNIAKRETKESMKAAFADMLKKTKGVMPLDIQLDNFGRSCQEELYRMFPNVTWGKPFNAQEKYAENYIKDFEQGHVRLQEGWFGANITAKKLANRRNPDKEQRGYTMSEIEEMYERLISDWNNTEVAEGMTRWQLMEANINPECQQWDDRSLRDILGMKKIASIKRGFISIQHSGTTYEYEVPNYHEVLSKLGNSWRVRVAFLPEKPNEISIFNYKDEQDPTKDTYICDCKEVDYVQRAKAEQTEEDGKKLGHFIQRRKQFERWVREEMDELPQLEPLKPEETAEQPEERMTRAEAEGVLGSGYVGKELMQDAEERFLDDAHEEQATKKQNHRKRYNRWQLGSDE